jgi:poly-gamma-glutamate synthesis protein (capsule biosynthesis protein)
MRFGGDVLLAGHYETAAEEDPALGFRDFELFHSADVALVNLECPVTTRGEAVPKPYNFRIHPKFLGPLKDAGITVLNLANNHMFDYGEIGFFDTIANIDSLGLGRIGAGRNREEAHRGFLFEKAGKKVGLLAYYQGGEAPDATDSSAGVASRRLPLVKRDIQWLKNRDSVDYIVVHFHWGNEKADTPDVDQQSFAHRVIDFGADLIVGDHVHVLQGIERYGDGIIVYSLGNLIFGGNRRHSYDTAVFEVRLTPSGVHYRVIPVGVRRWRLTALQDNEGAAVLERIRGLSELFPNTITIN